MVAFHTDKNLASYRVQVTIYIFLFMVRSM